MSVSLIHRNVLRAAKYINGVIFGSNLLLTNCLISASMGTAGDAIQQYYDILMNRKSKTDNEIVNKENRYCYTRASHMTAAGLTTGLVSHYWYIYLDKWLGTRKTFVIITKKVLYDQIVFSPINLFVYFSTLSILERSGIKKFKEELLEKGFENIYVIEWFIWPPAQLFNFYVLPLRYRILFDNIISLGFDIYSPYVKYKTQLKSEIIGKDNNNKVKE